MHIPDGYLSPPWVVATYAAAAGYLYTAYRRAGQQLTPDLASAMTVLAAAIFVAQMLNWPIPGGTSLHFVGGALAGILLGPWLGSLTMALVVTVQALVFHDGGITTLGANLLNMAVIDVLAGYYAYRLLHGRLGVSRALASAVGAWLGITLAGAAAGIEIGLSPSFPLGVEITLPVMAGWHALLGLVEAAITAAVVEALARSGWSILAEAEPPRLEAVAAA